ncbi:MAG: DUF2062 domain-containing protein [Mesorhizobium sp.]|nr:MAG: DUF2062 domain-containing protein [Mesorhizobium sp.]
MLFKRRKRATIWSKVRGLFWPTRSFRRSARYFTKRILRLTAAPHAVAAGVAAGVFASFLPFVGFHFIIAATVALFIRGNLAASALGTAIGNPITFPFIWAATLAVGRLILDGRNPGSLAPLHFGDLLRTVDVVHLWEPLLKPMTVGGVPLGIFFGLIFYGTTLWATTTFHKRRRLRLAESTRAVRPHRGHR